MITSIEGISHDNKGSIRYLFFLAACKIGFNIKCKSCVHCDCAGSSYFIYSYRTGSSYFRHVKISRLMLLTQLLNAIALFDDDIDIDVYT